MPSGPRISDVENITTLDIDAQHHGLKRPGEGHRVLLLEDRADFRQILHDYLVSNTYQVTAVQSGVEGLQEIIRKPFDIIICDMMMPKLGGEMFYWAVTRARPLNKSQP